MEFNKKYVFCIIIFVLSSLILTLGFYNNKWNAAEQGWFDEFQMDSESLVVGRLIKSQREGILSNSALLGRWYNLPNGKNNVLDQYAIYSEDLKGGNYGNYTSQIGLQGIVFSLIDKYTDFSNQKNIKVFQLITSIATALSISTIISWICLEFGIFSSLFALFTTIYSHWITVIGRNLYWVIWVMYLPMVISLILLSYESKKGKFSSLLTFILIYFAVFLKSASGYEYICTVLIAMMIPYVYYASLQNWCLQKISKRFFLVGSAGISGFFSAIIINAWQLSFELGSMRKGFAAIWYNVLKRTHGSSEKVAEVYKSSLESDILNVIYQYWNGIAINLTNIFPNNPFLVFSFEDLIYVFLIATVCVFASKKYAPSIEEKRNKLQALAICTWLSIFAPMSWFVLAKGHSYIHTHINHVLWHIPFTIFGFALTATVFHLIFKDILKSNHALGKIGLLLLILILVMFGFNSFRYSRDNVATIENLIKSSVTITESNGFTVYVNLQEGKIAYLKAKYDDSEMKNRFFLHILPTNQSVLTTERKESGFDNLDFEFKKYQVKIPFSPKYRNCAIVIRELPKYAINSIRTGQFTKDGRIWEVNISVDYSSYKKDVIRPADVTDNNWVNGISKDGDIILLENNLENIATVKDANFIELENGEKFKIRDIKYLESQWIHVILDGENIKNDFGTPRTIRFL